MTLDIIFFIFAGLGFYMGYNRGIISTFFTILSYTIGLIAAVRVAPAFSRFLHDVTNSDNQLLMFVAGFLLSLAIVMIVLRMVARGLEGILKTANINFINQILGGMLLGAFGILLYSAVLWFADRSNMIDPRTKEESMTYVYTKEFPYQMRGIIDRLKPTFTEFWNEMLDVLDKVEDMGIERSDTDATIYDLEEEDENR